MGPAGGSVDWKKGQDGATGATEAAPPIGGGALDVTFTESICGGGFSRSAPSVTGPK